MGNERMCDAGHGEKCHPGERCHRPATWTIKGHEGRPGSDTCGAHVSRIRGAQRVPVLRVAPETDGSGI